VRGDEGEAADASGYPVAEPFGRGAAGEELLLVFGDEIDVFLNLFLRHCSVLIAEMKARRFI
jgi:hypothetical protein